MISGELAAGAAQQAYKKAMPEIVKLVDKILEEFALDEKSNYEGLKPILGLLIGSYISNQRSLNGSNISMTQFYLDLRTLVRSATACFSAIAVWAGLSADAVQGFAQGIQDIGKLMGV